jgi:hypothetical protein
MSGIDTPMLTGTALLEPPRVQWRLGCAICRFRMAGWCGSGWTASSPRQGHLRRISSALNKPMIDSAIALS